MPTPGTINPADSNTKATAHYLHARHNLRSFGYFGPPLPVPASSSRSHGRLHRSEAGEDVSPTCVSIGTACESRRRIGEETAAAEAAAASSHPLYSLSALSADPE